VDILNSQHDRDEGESERDGRGDVCPSAGSQSAIASPIRRNDPACGVKLTDPTRLPEGLSPRAISFQPYIAVQHPANVMPEDIQVHLSSVASQFVAPAYCPAARQTFCMVVGQTVFGFEN
jgi:hypothetical protein